jgi:pimeloyl-ACP methyl ester carboxylesterase
LKRLIKLIGFGFNVLSYFHLEFAIKKALTLFAKPRKGRIESFMVKFLKQAHQEDIIIEDYTLRTYVFGKGPIKLLLIHGWESNTWRWRKLMRHLGYDTFTFYCIDAPAHGYSSGDSFDMDILLKGVHFLYNKIHPDFIIGHSMGGMANLLHAAHYPLKGDTKLICMASPHSLEYIFGLYYKAIGIGNRIKKHTKALFQKIYNKDLDYFSVPLNGKKIKSPLFIIHDKDDNLNSIECAEINHKTVINSTFVTVTDSNHSLQSEEVFTLIKKWIKD